MANYVVLLNRIEVKEIYNTKRPDSLQKFLRQKYGDKFGTTIFLYLDHLGHAEESHVGKKLEPDVLRDLIEIEEI